MSLPSTGGITVTCLTTGVESHLCDCEIHRPHAGAPPAFKRLTGIVVVQLEGVPPLGIPHFEERWKAAFVRFLLETPGSIEDWGSLPHEERIRLLQAEPEPTPESIERTWQALAILDGATFEPSEAATPYP